MIISTTQKCKGADGKEVTAPSVRKHLKYEMKSILQFLNERRVDLDIDRAICYRSAVWEAEEAVAGVWSISEISVSCSALHWEQQVQGAKL
jgi:hypothetical protein